MSVLFEEKKKIKIALDVEFKSSNIITGECFQLGFVAFFENPDPEMLSTDDWVADKLSVCFKSQSQDTEKNVMDFWSKFPEIYQRIESEAVEVSDGMKQVQNWLNNLYDNYNVTGFIAVLAAVDFPWFRSLYLTYCDQSLNRFSLPYKCLCIDSMIETFVTVFGYDKKQMHAFCMSERYPHTHYALDDAMECAYYYLRLMIYEM